MTTSPEPTPQAEAADDAVTGGGPSGADTLASDPVRRAAAQLELLNDEARESVLARMNPDIAQKIRDYIASQPDNRPHGAFSHDVATRRKMLREMADRVQARRTAEVDQQLAATAPEAAVAQSPVAGGAAPLAQPMAPNGMATPAPAAPSDPLDQLRTLHPAAIARAMQGERAEAWAIVLDRLDVHAKGALQLYLDATARTAIEEARARQSELAATAPALISTIESAIARTVVPRAMREHHQLLSTTPMTWSSGMGA